MKLANDTALAAWVKLSMATDSFLDRHSRPLSSSGEVDQGEDEEGSTTVEYAIGAIATAAFAGLLLAVLKSGGVKNMLTNIIQTALSV